MLKGQLLISILFAFRLHPMTLGLAMMEYTGKFIVTFS